MVYSIENWLWFWGKVDKGPSCWIWTSSTNGKYGHFVKRGKDGLAHRLAYQWCKGSIPKHLQVDHICNVPLCVNPSHLQLLTNAENMARTVQIECKRGHRLEGENLYINANHARGSRQCRACHAFRQRRLRRRKQHVQIGGRK